jgi:hypothetical protein
MAQTGLILSKKNKKNIDLFKKQFCKIRYQYIHTYVKEDDALLNKKIEYFLHVCVLLITIFYMEQHTQTRSM